MKYIFAVTDSAGVRRHFYSADASAAAAEHSEHFATAVCRVVRLDTLDLIDSPAGDQMNDIRMRYGECLLWVEALEWFIREHGLQVPTWQDIERTGWRSAVKDVPTFTDTASGEKSWPEQVADAESEGRGKFPRGR